MLHISTITYIIKVEELVSKADTSRLWQTYSRAGVDSSKTFFTGFSRVEVLDHRKLVDQSKSLRYSETLNGPRVSFLSEYDGAPCARAPDPPVLDQGLQTSKLPSCCSRLVREKLEVVGVLLNVVLSAALE